MTGVSNQEVEKAKEWGRRRVAKEKLPPWMEEDRGDFQIDVDLAIEKARKTFNLQKSAWQTYAHSCVGFALKESRRTLNPLPRTMIDACQKDEELKKKLTPLPIDTKIKDGITLADCIIDQAKGPEELVVTSAESVELKKTLISWMDVLTPKEKAILIGMFFEDKNQTQLAKELGMASPESVAAAKSSALKKIRNSRANAQK